MRYRLAVLTHGRSVPLERCLRSFVEQVTPAPSSVSVYADGSARASDVYAAVRAAGGHLPRLSMTHPFLRLGFCAATRALWNDATTAAEEYVFWLEHDFVFLRPVDLRELAVVLDLNPLLAQVALLRGPENPSERAAGGVIEARPGDFRQVRQAGIHTAEWLEHRAFFTTNPSLMRRQFMLENRWPGYSSECEGRFGIDLVERGFSFAYWGDGTPWVEHVGVRDGHGY